MTELNSWSVNKWLDKANNSNVLELKSKNEPLKKEATLNVKSNENEKQPVIKHILTPKEITSNITLFFKCII